MGTSYKTGNAMSGCSLSASRGQHVMSDGVESWAPHSTEILIAEGDTTTRHAIINCLREQQMRAVAASDAKELMSRLAAKDVGKDADLVVLDLQFGKNSGLDLLRTIRSRTNVPVIITGCYPRGAIDPLIGLKIGADDYLMKPFGLRELVARIRAIFRRRPAPQCVDRHYPKGAGYRFGGWNLDLRSRRLTNPLGRQVTLTRSQYVLLLAFLRAPRRPLSRQTLWREMNVNGHLGKRTVDAQILRLRRKLVTEPGAPCLIRTERGLGYEFTGSVEEVGPDVNPKPN